MNDGPREKAAEGPGDAQCRQFTGRTAVGVIAFLFLVILLRPLIPDPYWPRHTYSWTDVILAVSTIALWAVAIRQLAALNATVKAMRDSTRVASAALDHAKETATAQLGETRRANELSLRAWLLVESVDYVETDRRMSSVVMTIRNYGKLPATQVVGVAKFYVMPARDLFFTIPPEIVVPGLHVIGAGLSREYPFPLFDVSEAQLDLIENGTATLYLTSRFKYRDALGTTRGDTAYCAYFVPGTEQVFIGSLTVRDRGRFVEIPASGSVS